MEVVKAIPHLEQRRPNTHKGSYGRILIIAGSLGMTGAACLCAQGAMRAGAGYVILAIPKSLNAIIASNLTCALSLPLPETGELTLSPQAKEKLIEMASRSDVVALGPGISLHSETKKLIPALVEAIEKPMVVDADALTILSEDISILKRVRGQLVLTPHPGEMSRLLKTTVQEVQADREGVAGEFARKYGVVLVLKGYHSVVTDGRQVYVNETGNPGMATAGSGDVLTGIISALIGQGLGTFDAAVMGTYIHGLAGDIAKEKVGEISLIASDIVDALPEAFKRHHGYSR